MPRFRVGQKVRIKSEDVFRSLRNNGCIVREKYRGDKEPWEVLLTIKRINLGTTSYCLVEGNNFPEGALVAIKTIKDKLSEVLKDV